MKFASKVNRREHKIITTPLLSLDKFNRATVEEARKVIAGTSHWFAFDDDGNMKVLHPNDSPENQGPREAAKAKQVDVIRRPDFYRAELERMKNDGPSLSDYQKACLTELEELQNARAAIDPHGSEIIKTTNQMYDVHARLMAAEENKDQETQIKLTIELEEIDGRLEKLSKAPAKNLTPEDEARLKEIDKAINIVDEQLGGLEGFHEARHEKEIRELTDMLRYADAAEHYNHYIDELNNLIGKIPSLSFNPFLVSWKEASDYNDREDASRMKSRIEELAELLEGAAETMPDVDERIARLEAILNPLPHKTRRLEAIENKTKYADMKSDAFTPQRREILRAVMAIISRSIEAPTLADAHEEFNRHVKLIAHSDYTSSFFAALYEEGRKGRERSEQLDRDLYTTEERVLRLNDYLQQFQSVVRGEAEGKLDEEQLAAIQDFDSRWEEKDWFDPRTLLERAMSTARGLRRDDYMRYHNSFPDAVNFIRASAQSEFLLEHRDVAKSIEDAASFFGSAWVYAMGNAEIRVDPVLLDKAKLSLRGKNQQA